MEANKTASAPFARKLLRNQFLLLFVGMGISLVVFIVGGLIRLLSH